MTKHAMHNRPPKAGSARHLLHSQHDAEVLFRQFLLSFAGDREALRRWAGHNPGEWVQGLEILAVAAGVVGPTPRLTRRLVLGRSGREGTGKARRGRPPGATRGSKLPPAKQGTAMKRAYAGVRSTQARAYTEEEVRAFYAEQAPDGDARLRAFDSGLAGSDLTPRRKSVGLNGRVPLTNKKVNKNKGLHGASAPNEPSGLNGEDDA